MGSDISTYQSVVNKMYAVRFVNMMYLSFGSTFGGLLYGINKIPTFYSWVAYLSTGFWSNTGILTVILRNQELPCRELAEGATASTVVIGQECQVNGNVLLSAVGISDRWYLPTYGLVFLSLGSLFWLLLLYPVLVRPWSHQVRGWREEGSDEQATKSRS